MKTQLRTRKNAKRGLTGERGAALVMMMLTSLLLLTAGSALLYTTSLSAVTAYDSTAEYQAYYAAEAGLESALNALRGHAQPSPLFAAIPAGGPIPAVDKVNFRKAVTPDDSNHSDDDSADARLSRWLRYNAPAAAGEFPDRVVIEPDDPADYTPRTGTAFRTTVTDPDETSRAAFSTEARWSISAGVSATILNTSVSSSIQIPVGLNVAAIFFTPAPAIPTSAPLNTYPQVTSPLGTFNIAVPIGSLGIIIPPGVDLQLIVRQTYPRQRTMVFTGRLSGTVTPLAYSLQIDFQTPVRRSTPTIYSIPSSSQYSATPPR